MIRGQSFRAGQKSELQTKSLVDISDFFFSARGGGRLSQRRQEGGGRFFIDNPRRGGFQEGDGVSRRVVWSELENLGGGGLNIFFGAETSTKKVRVRALQSPRIGTNLSRNF